MPISTSILPISSLQPTKIAAWANLVECSKYNFSLGPEWTSISTNTIGHEIGEVFAYYEEEDGLLGLIPFFVESSNMWGIPVKMLQATANLISYHAEILTSGTHEEFITRFLEAAPKWDVFQMSNVDISGPTAQALEVIAGVQQLPLQVIPGDISPYLNIDGDWESFLRNMNKKFRYKLRKRRELLESEGGEFELVWLNEQTHVEQLLSAILTVEANSWKADEGIDIASSPVERNYYANLLPFLAGQRALLANVLYVGGCAAAYSLCCNFNGWVGHLKTSFDQSYASVSPGTLVVDACIESAFGQGAVEFDFLGDASNHKLVWSKSLRNHANYFLFSGRAIPKLLGKLKTANWRSSELA